MITYIHTTTIHTHTPHHHHQVSQTSTTRTFAKLPIGRSEDSHSFVTGKPTLIIFGNEMFLVTHTFAYTHTHTHTNSHTHTHTRARARPHARTHARTQL